MSWRSGDSFLIVAPPCSFGLLNCTEWHKSRTRVTWLSRGSTVYFKWKEISEFQLRFPVVRTDTINRIKHIILVLVRTILQCLHRFTQQENPLQLGDGVADNVRATVKECLIGQCAREWALKMRRSWRVRKSQFNREYYSTKYWPINDAIFTCCCKTNWLKNKFSFECEHAKLKILWKKSFIQLFSIFCKKDFFIVLKRGSIRAFGGFRDAFLAI